MTVGSVPDPRDYSVWLSLHKIIIIFSRFINLVNCFQIFISYHIFYLQHPARLWRWDLSPKRYWASTWIQTILLLFFCFNFFLLWSCLVGSFLYWSALRESVHELVCDWVDLFEFWLNVIISGVKFRVKFNLPMKRIIFLVSCLFQIDLLFLFLSFQIFFKFSFSWNIVSLANGFCSEFSESFSNFIA